VDEGQPSLAIVIIALIVAATWLYSEIALFFIAVGYASIGVVLHAVRWVRHHAVTRTA
jgi:hypothetical protein